VLDRAAGSAENSSVDSDGRFQAADQPGLDWSGRHVVFASRQPLVVDDTNAVSDVCVRGRPRDHPPRRRRGGPLDARGRDLRRHPGDEVAVYNRALAPARIAAHYESSSAARR
jgi:hypothetical protein